MSEHAPPAIYLLSQLLSGINNIWFDLGIQLRVTPNELEGIQQTNPAASPSRLMVHMLDKWLKSNISFGSWRQDLIKALKVINVIALAEELESQLTTDSSDLKFSAECHARTAQSSTSSLQVTPYGSVLTRFDLIKYDGLKASYAHMLIVFRQCLGKIQAAHLNDIKCFLSTIMDDEEFINCATPDKVIDRLSSQVHMYRISTIQQTVEMFLRDDEGMCRVVESYREKKERFLCGTRIVDFRPQTSRLAEDMCEVQFVITKSMACEKTLKEIDTLAQESFGPCYNHLSEMTRCPTADHEYVTWEMPKMHAIDIILWAKAHLAHLNDHGVKEVTVGRVQLKLCSCFQQVSTTTPIDSRENQDAELVRRLRQQLEQQQCTHQNEMQQKDRRIQQQVRQIRLLQDKDTRPDSCQQKCAALEQEMKSMNKELDQAKEIITKLGGYDDYREIVKLLNLEAGIRYDEDVNTIPNTLLQAACMRNRQIVQALLEKPAEIELNISLEERECTAEDKWKQKLQTNNQEITPSEEVALKQETDQKQSMQFAHVTTEKDELKDTAAKKEILLSRQQLQERLSSVAKGREEQLHSWVVEREEVELTEEVVGRGSWGEVKVAKFRGLRVAAKFLHNMIISEYNQHLFTREMEIAAKIRHPNLLLFIGATREGEAVILTELMPTSLQRELQRRVMPQVQITSIAQDVACALRYLHQWRPSPIIHRDISSANVLLEPLPNGWRAKVSDFGSANFMNAIVTAAPGSPAYAAPEARYSDQHSPKMDTFSYGVLLVEMCIRKLPEPNPAQREALILQIQWAAMVSLVRRCTSERSADRPSMGDIMELLAPIKLQLVTT